MNLKCQAYFYPEFCISTNCFYLIVLSQNTSAKNYWNASKILEEQYCIFNVSIITTITVTMFLYIVLSYYVLILKIAFKLIIVV